MEKKSVVILEIIGILIAFVYLFVTVSYPKYKKSLGSSDHFIKSENYKNMLEFHIDQNVHFAVVLSFGKNTYFSEKTAEVCF